MGHSCPFGASQHQGVKGSSKELCDCLVVCDPDVIIFSVKGIRLTGDGDPELNWRRWQVRGR